MKRIGWGLCVFLLGMAKPVGAGDTFKPGPSITVQDVPEIPLALTEKLDRYANIRSARLLDWLPRGGMLVATRFGETEQVHWVLNPGGRREQLTFFRDKVDFALACPRADCPRLLYARDQGGDEFFQLYRLDRDTGASTLLTDGKSRNMSACWNKSGDRVAYVSTRRNGKDYDLYLVDPEDPKSDRRLIELEGQWNTQDFSPDGQLILLQQFLHHNNQALFLFDQKTSRLTRITPEGEKPATYEKAIFSRDGRKILFITDRDSDWLRLAWVEVAAKDFRPHFLSYQPRFDVEQFALAADNQTLVLDVNQAGFSQLVIVPWSDRPVRARPVAIPRGLITGLQAQAKGTQVAFSLAGSRLAGDVYSLDLRSQKVERWTYSESAGLDLNSFVEPELIGYPTFDQVDNQARQVPALLYLPPKRFQPPYPVMIGIHGGPEAQSRPGFLWSMNYRLNEMGIALVYPNVRGSTGYGKGYATLDDGYGRQDSVQDIGALLAWLAQDKRFDAARVCVSGGSYGGFMSLASLTAFNDKLRCGVSYVGISNLVTFLEKTETYRRDLRRMEYGDERIPEMRAFLQRISPLTNADKIKNPLLVLQGANDPRVPASEADQIVARLKKNGVPVWYMLANDEGHGFAKKSNTEYAQLLSIRFLEEYLLK